MTKHTAKGKFNQNAPSNQHAPAIVEYAAAAEPVKRAMEKLIEAIDRNPDDFSVIIDYGHPPLVTLGNIASEMIKVQGAYNDQINGVGAALKALDAGSKDLALKTLAQTGADLADTLKRAGDLVTACSDAARDISLYLGASKEVLRRYNEEYIPEANKQFEGSQDPDDERYLKDVMNRKEDFIDRITVLEGSRGASVISAQQLRQMTKTMKDQRKTLEDTASNGQSERKAKPDGGPKPH